MPINFFTIFPITPWSNVLLTKDVGMIPYILHKEYGYDSTLVSVRNDDYPHLEQEVKGLKRIFVKKGFFNKCYLLLIILKKFKKINVLQCYHLSKTSFLVLFFFKLLHGFSNKKITYLKLDANRDIKSLNPNMTLRFFMKFIDIVTVETLELHKYLNETNLLKKRVEYLPNGFYPQPPEVKFHEKENIILTVGRIGSTQKASHILLEAFEQFSKQDTQWRLEMVGPIEESFKPVIASFFERHPHLINRVHFIGPVYDRTILASYYRKAKLFAMTSRWESFGLVFTEAMSVGCTIITSDVCSASDITNNSQYGAIFPVDDSQALAKLLLSYSANEMFLENNCSAIQKFAHEKFYWPAICGSLNKLILDKIK